MVSSELLEAVEDGDLTTLKRFDQNVLNENVSDEFGCNCLHYAARQGGVEVLQFLVQQRGFTGSVRSNVGKFGTHLVLFYSFLVCFDVGCQVAPSFME